MAIHAPHLFINRYLQDKITLAFEAAVPLMPTMPSDIDALVSTFPESQGMFAVYDRMYKLRKRAFPHIKCEQLLYYFYKTDDPELLFETHGMMQDLLDRGDESAQELNNWIANMWQAQSEEDKYTIGVDIVTGLPEEHKTIKLGNKSFLIPYFHEIKLFQLEETRDVVEIGAARTVVGNKMIIDYEWHSS